MASAAYWIGSAAHAIYASSDTTQVGSIGVVAAHVDVSKAYDMAGVKVTEITAGTYKRIASNYSPLTQDGRASIQDSVDQIYSVFLNEVAKHRGASGSDVVHDRMADGRIFMGQKAIDAGLVDGISTLSTVIGNLSRGDFPASFGAKTAVSVQAEASETPVAGAASDTLSTSPKENPMNIEVLKAEHPEVFQAIHDAAFAEGREAGASAENNRIKAVFAQALPGHDALIQTLAFDGKTTGPEAAAAILAAEKVTRDQIQVNLKADAPKPLPGTPAAETLATNLNPHEISAQASNYIAKKAAEGITVSPAEAVAIIMKEK
jgi:type IV secretory pathway TrbL component